VTFDQVAAVASGLQDAGQPVTVEAVRAALADDGIDAAANGIYKHLAEWRADHEKAPEPPRAELPPALLADLADWARRYAQDAGAADRDALARADSDMQALLDAGNELEAARDDLTAQVAGISGERDDALASLAERDDVIERLTAELANARQVAMDALVGKAKDQLAIEGKDAQIADLRAQIERNVAAQAALSDARLTAQMELVGATTARDSLAAELRDVRALLDAQRNKR
jgi:DNA repair exonuclease SbcCD ATPase subunit